MPCDSAQAEGHGVQAAGHSPVARARQDHPSLLWAPVLPVGEAQRRADTPSPAPPQISPTAPPPPSVCPYPLAKATPSAGGSSPLGPPLDSDDSHSTSNLRPRIPSAGKWTPDSGTRMAVPLSSADLAHTLLCRVQAGLPPPSSPEPCKRRSSMNNDGRNVEGRDFSQTLSPSPSLS